MKSTKQKPGAVRRRTSNRYANNDIYNRRMNTSLGQTVPISSYISLLRDENGNLDREKCIQLFQSERYG